jgi:hypothetical protein
MEKAVENVKRLEEQLASARENARASFLASATETLAQLKAIGFHYELVEKNGAPKMGRPKKEAKNGVAMV